MSVDADTIIFLHIPKTAGTTLKNVIERHYPPESRYTDELSRQSAIDAFINLPAARRAAIRMFWGHMPFGLHEYLPGRSTYFTILRDPVDRVISHYYFLLSRPDLFWVPPEIQRDNLSLHEVIERGLIVDITNMQTRKLAGLPHLFPRDGYRPEHLETAKRNLRDHFSVVGLLDHFDETLLLLQQAYGWQKLHYLQQNVNRRRPARATVPPETIALIEREEALDMALYAYGQTLFAEQVARQGPDFSRRVRRFQFMNRHVYGPLLRWQQQLEPRRSYQRAWQAAAWVKARLKGGR